METRKTYCAVCTSVCGLEVEIKQDRATKVRGDPEHPLSKGFTCIKGRSLDLIHADKDRILRPQKRKSQGGFSTIGLSDATNQISQKLNSISQKHGPRSIGAFFGSGASLTGNATGRQWLRHLGSPSVFSVMTIDQPAKFVAIRRLGVYEPGLQRFEDSDVCLLAGMNPAVSMLAGFPPVLPAYNPVARIKQSISQGLKLIVIDPCKTETARMAHIHLQSKPGEDPTIFAGFIHVIVAEELYDSAFCKQYATRLNELKQAVSRFTPEYVSRRAGIDKETFVEAARLFGTSLRGTASGGTGTDMAPFPNLTEHLILTLNMICGRTLREGDVVGNPGVFSKHRPIKASVIPPSEPWTRGEGSRLHGLGNILGEIPAGVLADEILTPGDGQIRAMIIDGANPVVAVPDQLKLIKAFKHLELLVVIDPRMTPTAQLADYILPPRLQFERPGITMGSEMFLYEPHGQYTPKIAEPPIGSELVNEYEFFLDMASHMTTAIPFGFSKDQDIWPDEDVVLETMTANSRISLSEVKQHPSGHIFKDPNLLIEPRNSTDRGLLDLLPVDVQDELHEVLAEDTTEANDHDFLLIGRRLREVQNSVGTDLPHIRARLSVNTASMHPSDMARNHLNAGDTITITSSHGEISGIVGADSNLREGAIAMAHCWGGLPEKDNRAQEIGSNTGRLISSDKHCASITHMPRMTAIPVSIKIESSR